MMLARREHHAKMFKLASDIVRKDHGLGWNDQTPINAAAVKTGTPVRLVEEEWNFIHPFQLGPGWEDHMGAHIYHGAGEPSRIHWLPRVKW